MAYKILISEATHADVDGAIGYIAETLGSPGAAAALLDEYEYCLKLIRDNPYIFGLDLFVSEALNRQIRRCSVKRYSFYYLIDVVHGIRTPIMVRIFWVPKNKKRGDSRGALLGHPRGIQQRKKNNMK